MRKLSVEKFKLEIKKLVEKIQNNKRNKYYYVLYQKYFGLGGAITLEIYTSYRNGKFGRRIFKYSTGPFATIIFVNDEYQNSAEVHKVFGNKINIPTEFYNYTIGGDYHTNPQAPYTIYRLPKELIIQFLQNIIA